MARDRVSFRGLGRLAWEAFRRRWWLLLPIAGAQWLWSVSLERAPDVLLAGWPGKAWREVVYTVADDAGCGLMAAVMIAVALTGARREPLVAVRTARWPLAALPTILLAEVVVSGPGWLMHLVFEETDSLPLPMLAAQMVAFLAWMAVSLGALALFGATVPLAIDQRLSPLAAVKRAFQLTAGHRRRLLWMAPAFGLAELVIALGGSGAFELAGQGEHWASEWAFHVTDLLDALALTALYLELSRLASSAPDRTAETFD